MAASSYNCADALARSKNLDRPMSTSTLGTFVALLKKSQLLTAEQVGQVSGELSTRFPEAKSLARELIRRGWVTAYQVNQLSQGKFSDLVLGSYVILERLGEGGMGQVFKARHKSMGRVVALKVLRKERLVNPDAIKRFHREIQAAARLSHPNIVMAYDADHVGNNHFFVMEYVDGIDLSQLVKKKGPLSPGRACNYIAQSARGLQHAHEQGMVHRDIKPHNLLLTRDAQTVKILDMGLARLGESEQDSAFSQLTQDGKVVGTPDYIAPEQARNSHTADIRSDIYSLGCTFYFLVSGRVPFPGGGSIMEKLMKHQTEEPIPIQLVAPNLPDPIAEIVHKMIRRNPDERYQTPAEVAAALEPYVGGTDGDLTTASSPVVHLGDLGSLTAGTPASTPRLRVPTPAPTRSAPAPSRKIWGMVAAVAAIFVIGAALIGVAAIALMGRSSSTISSNKDHDPAPPDKDGAAKDKLSTKDKDKSLVEKTPLDYLAETPISAGKRPLRSVPGLIGVLGEPRGRHWSGAPISRVLFNRDGRLLATATGFGDNGVHVWDADSLAERGRLPVGAAATNMTFGPDGHWLAVSSFDGNVRIFDVTEADFGKVLAQYQIPNLGLASFTPDGRLAVGTVAERDARSARTVKVWDTRTGNIRRSYSVTDGVITTAVLSPVGLKLAIPVLGSVEGRGNSAVRLYDIEADKLLHKFEVGAGFGLPLFSPDGKHLLVVGGTSIKMYDAASGEMRHEAATTYTSSPTLSPDGKTLAFLVRTRDGKSSIHFYDVAAGKMASHTVDVDTTVFFSQFTPDSKTVLAFGYRQPLAIIDVSTGKTLPPLKGWSGGTAAVGISPNGKRLAMATNEPALRLWDLASRDEILPVTGRAGPVQFSVLANGERAIWAGSTEYDGARLVNVLRRWDMPRGEPIVYRDASTAATAWAYDRQHNVLAYPHMVSEGGGTAIVVKLINGHSGREVGTLPALPNSTWISALTFTPDGKSLACAAFQRGKDGQGRTQLVIRDASTGAEQFAIPERPEQVMGLFFSRHGKTLASLGRDGNLKFFDVASRGEKTLPATPGLTTQVSAMAWHPDGKLLATGTYPQNEQQPFRIWESATGKLVHRFPGKAMATAVAFQPHGMAFAGADADGNVTLWNLSDEKVTHHWQLGGPVSSLTFSPDSRHLITGNGNGTVYVLHLDDGKP